MSAHTALPFVSLALLLSACGGDAADSPADDGTAPPTAEAHSKLSRDLEPAPDAAALQALTDGQAAFALSLYPHLGADGGNLFYSPLSIHQALTMAYAGAVGPTADEMAAVLHLGAEPHVAQNALDLSLAAAADAPVEGEGSPLILEIANSIWGAPDLRWEQAFLDTLALNYGAGLRLTDFAADPEAARLEINAWVADVTRDRIPNLIPDGIIDAATAMVLVNAIFFKGSWATAFEIESTSDADFALAPNAGEIVPVPTMHTSFETRYAAGEGYQAAVLPYEGGRASMLLVVPADLAAFEARLDDALYAEILGGLSHAQVTFALPRFEFRKGALLSTALKALGMQHAFDDADFSAMTKDDQLAISEVIHEAFVKVDEEGTEAAAATAVVFGRMTGDVEGPPHFELRADRPFLFFIRDEQTDAILFAGRVVDPRG